MDNCMQSYNFFYDKCKKTGKYLAINFHQVFLYIQMGLTASRTVANRLAVKD